MKKKKTSMKFKTRLLITFFTFTLLPLCCIVIATAFVGAYMINLRTNANIGPLSAITSPGGFIGSMENVASHAFLMYMIISIAIILAVTSFFMTKWIQRGVFDPINRLNLAMKKISSGNLDYALETNSEDTSEIGDLYNNYEEMRLRLKESADEKIESERQNRELVSNISHDLKTPITSVKGYVEGIMDGVADTPEKMDRYIKTIYSKANDMDRLINELTVYSGIDGGRIPYH